MFKERHSQRGASLLLLLFLVTGIGASIFLSAWNNSRAQQERQRQTSIALQTAKEALIGDAATYRQPSNGMPKPARLRCPELLSAGSPTEGQAKTSCTTQASLLGRFPWNTLKTERLVDGDGEPLWYAVSPGFSSSPINSSTQGQLQVDGTPNAAVAIIIAPGAPLPGQSRSLPSAANPPQPGNYLDLTNAMGAAFITNAPASTFNDRVIVITQSELFAAANKVVLAEVRGLDDQAPGLPINGLRRYYQDNGQFPWAAPIGGGSAIPNQIAGGLPFNDLFFTGSLPWLTANNWLAQIGYTRISANSAQINIGSTVMKVVPCTALPCP